MLRFIKSGSALNSARETVDIPVGPYSFFLLSLEGTTTTAQTLSADDVGTIRVNRAGREIQGEEFAFYHDLTALKGGFPAATLPAAGASRIVAAIPCGVPGIPNVLDVATKEELDIILEFSSTLDTRFGANPCTYKLYGFLNPALMERYELIVQQADLQAAAAGRLEHIFPGVNVAALLMYDSGADVDTINVTSDGRVIVDNLDDDVLLDITNLNNRVESAQTLIEVNLAPSGTIPETQNTTTALSVQFSGAGTLEITALRVMPSQAAGRSGQRQAAFLRSKGYSGVSPAHSLPRGAVVI